MIIHELHCGTMRPRSRRLINGSGGLLQRSRLVCRCLLVRVDDGWTLIDTGLGTADLADPVTRLGSQYLRRTVPDLDPRQTAVAQLSELGIDPHDVRDIVLTHLDLDHVGGIADFPWARIHLNARHLQRAVPALASDLAHRLRPVQWAHGPQWSPHDLDSRWRGRPAADLGGNLWLVALDGHCGVVIQRPGDTPLIHAGDAIFSGRTLHGAQAPAGIALFERLMRTDARAWASSRAWLQARAQEGARVICTHDPAD